MTNLSTRRHTHDKVRVALPTGSNLLMSDAGCRKVITALAEQENWPAHKWVFDGQKTLYVAGGTGGTSFLPQHETVYEVGTALLSTPHNPYPTLTCFVLSALVMSHPKMASPAIE